MAVPYELAATAIKNIIDTEFSAEGFTALHDCIHEATGTRRTTIGISPLRRRKMPGNEMVAQTYIWIQFYDVWKKEIDPEQQVNPFRIAGFQHRLEAALERAQATIPSTNEVWYFMPETTEFPRDPTGNKTRFEMTVRCYGDSGALTETRT